jgi:hypothetical protein
MLKSKTARIPSTFSAIQAADLRKWNGNEQELQFQRLAQSLLMLRRKRQLRSLLLSVCALAVALFLAIIGTVTAFRVESMRNFLLGYFNVDFHNELFVFDTGVFKGTLSAQELYYLIGSASSYGKDFKDLGGWDLDELQSHHLEDYIYSLKNRNLVEVYVSDTPDTAKAVNVQGKKTISIRPTERGKNLLIYMGIGFDGKVFTNGP